MNRLALLVSLFALPAFCAPRACIGNLSVGSFRLAVQPEGGGQALPVRTVIALREGQKLKYEPAQLPEETKDKAEVAVVLVPATDRPDAELEIFDPVKAAAPHEWTVPHEASVVALVFGPHGLSVKKLKSLVGKNREILSELADYAEQNSKVEGLVEALAASEQSGGNLDAALSGFSAKYGVSIPKLDSKAATDQQARVLLQALLPAVNSYDPLSSRQAVMQQSAGLAASVAGMFFGTPVGLAAGGASLFQNMRTLMFPGMEFRSAFAQNASDGLALCAKRQENKSRTRMAYLWAHRVPNAARPSVALAGEAHAPIGAKSVLRLGSDARVKDLARAREWQLAPAAGGDPVPVPVTVQANGPALELDLGKVKAAAGEYALEARWDWEKLPVAGKIRLYPFGDLKAARITAKSRGRLAEGNGPVSITLEGADFQFVERLALEKAGSRGAQPVELPFTLPKGRRGGEQRTLETDVDTQANPRGAYRLLLAQGDGLTYEVPFEVLPPNPKIANLPLRANLGDAQQSLTLEGSGLDRVEALLTDAGTFELGPAGASARPAVFRIAPEAKKGTRYAVRMKVQGIEDPIEVPSALEIASPRPRIVSARKSLASENGVALREGEVPAGSPVSFALSLENAEGSTSVEVGCGEDRELRRKLTLSPGDRNAASRLDLAGEGMLFLSLDPGSVGQPGCRLNVVAAAQSGKSDPFPLGQVVRVPRIERFVLTDEKVGEAMYAGTLEGRDLETIEKAGWDARNGAPVQGIPTAAGDPQKQVLRIALPWPAPAPHAPVYVWLRGEQEGRATSARF